MYTKTSFSVSSPPQCQSHAVVCVSTPRMYPPSGYFLVCIYLNLAMIFCKASKMFPKFLYIAARNWAKVETNRMCLLLDFIFSSIEFQSRSIFCSTSVKVLKSICQSWTSNFRAFQPKIFVF